MADIKKIINLYSKGKSLRAIGDEVGVSFQRVDQLLKKQLTIYPYIQELRKQSLLDIKLEKSKLRMRTCLYCGKEFDYKYTKNKRFCNQVCVGKFFNNCMINRTITK